MEPAGYPPITPDSLEADPRRRAILARLASGEASVLELAEPFAMSQTAISTDLKVLERAGLISHSQDAQRPPQARSASAQAGRRLGGALPEILHGEFDRLDNYLRTLQSKEKKHAHKHNRKRRFHKTN
jgi:DNA-binding transcriptional ArsR family regulator